MTRGALTGLLAAIVAAGTGLLLLRGAARISGWLLLVAGAALMAALIRPPAGALAFTMSLLASSAGADPPPQLADGGRRRCSGPGRCGRGVQVNTRPSRTPILPTCWSTRCAESLPVSAS